MEPKSQSADLAVFGGPPAFPGLVHVGRPNLPDRERFLDAVNRILDRNLLTNDGPELRALEGRIAELTGVRQAVAVANATLGLQLLARALDLRGRVLMPAFTFVATAHAFRWIGLEPVFCDVDPATHNLDPAGVAARLEAGGVAAVVGVHVWGRLCAPLELEELCRRAGVPLIFDAAHALGCAGYGRGAGAFGTAEVLSLHATKICHSFEGGVITTRDGALAEKLRRMRNFGFAGYDEVTCLGINLKLPEVSAAMGLASLEELERYREVNHRNRDAYRAGLSDLRGFRLLEAPADQRSNGHYVVAEFDASWPEGTRDVLCAALHAEGVLVRRYFFPGCHRMEPYRTEQPAAAADLPHTDSLCRRVLCFPNGTAVNTDDIGVICALTRLILAHLPAVRARLAGA